MHLPNNPFARISGQASYPPEERAEEEQAEELPPPPAQQQQQTHVSPLKERSLSVPITRTGDELALASRDLHLDHPPAAPPVAPGLDIGELPSMWSTILSTRRAAETARPEAAGSEAPAAGPGRSPEDLSLLGLLLRAWRLQVNGGMVSAFCSGSSRWLRPPLPHLLLRPGTSGRWWQQSRVPRLAAGSSSRGSSSIAGDLRLPRAGGQNP